MVGPSPRKPEASSVRDSDMEVGLGFTSAGPWRLRFGVERRVRDRLRDLSLR